MQINIIDLMSPEHINKIHSKIDEQIEKLDFTNFGKDLQKLVEDRLPKIANRIISEIEDNTYSISEEIIDSIDNEKLSEILTESISVMLKQGLKK